MIYLIIDVQYYQNDNSSLETASVAGIRFEGIEQNNIISKHSVQVENVEPYQSGQFYKREMPCILALLASIKENYDVIIIDGYVYLDGKKQAGLGKHLYDALERKKPIIGIAKNKFHSIDDFFAVYRGISKHPLYITVVDFELHQALQMVKNLEGKHRLPNIVKAVDSMCRLSCLQYGH